MFYKIAYSFFRKENNFEIVKNVFLINNNLNYTKFRILIIKVLKRFIKYSFNKTFINQFK